MKIRSVLIVPSFFITTASHRGLNRFKKAVRSSLRGDFKGASNALNEHMLCTEIQHYGDLPKVLGRENTYMLGSYYPEYTLPELPADTRYPSLHLTPECTPIPEAMVPSVLEKVDAVVIGIKSGQVGERIRLLAKKKGILTAVMDYFDDLEVYSNSAEQVLYRGLKPGRDFDIFFKHDLPLGLASEKLLPLAPMPVRKESFPRQFLPIHEREISIFYRGQKRTGVLRSDRTRISEIIRENIPQALIENQENFANSTLQEYWNKLKNSKIALTPAGKVWDSTRHTEIGMFGCVPIIPQPNCETVNSLVRDGENCLSYRARRENGQNFTIENEADVLDNIRSILSSSQDLQRIAKYWTQEIDEHHTTLARARYLIKGLEGGCH